MSGYPSDASGGLLDPRAGSAVRDSVSAVLGSVGLAVYVLDGRGSVVTADDPLALLLPPGCTPRAGRTLWEADPSLGVSEAGEALHSVLNGGGPTVVRRPSEGDDRFVEFSAVMSGDEVAVCCRDVTADRAAADQSADRARRLLRKVALLDVARETIFIREMDDRISYWNLGAAALYGRPAATAMGSSARTTLQAEPDEYDAATAALLRDGEWSGELKQNANDGRVWIADCRWQLSRDAHGDPSFVLCVMTDVTDVRRERDALFRAQRMDSLGALAGGMAHDLNNVLTPILLSTQLLHSGETDPLKRSLLESIETSAERGAEMIRQVMTFARGEESRRQLLDVDVLLEQLTAFCAEVLPKSIMVTTHVARNVPRVLGDRTQLLQILMNFVTNARDAMPLGGQLTVTARDVAGGGSGGDQTPSVLITVQDTGTGMSEQTVAQVFDPFFTTKAVGDGTGLGLSTSIAIARGHGGDLEVKSTLGQGSRFSLRLPASSSGTPEPHGDVRPLSATHQGRGELVLVVDDESTIRTIVQHTLEANGYETVCAGNGMEAIALLEATDVAVDLVLTDMTMPVMDGAAMAAYLSDHHPDIPLIVASGIETTEATVRAVHSGVRHFLTKPFSTDEMLNAARDALDVRPAPGAGTGVIVTPSRIAPPVRDGGDARHGAEATRPQTSPEIGVLIEQEQERARLAAVRDLHLVDTPPEHRFDRITDLARKIFKVPVAQITLVDEFDHFTKSGLEDGGAPYTPRRDSLCDVTIRTPELLVVNDATEDPRFSYKKTVTGERHIRFYAGRPLSTSEGHAVGALCLIDTEPRELTRHEEVVLEEMGQWVERELRDPDALGDVVEVQQTLVPVDLLGRKHFDVAGIRLPAEELSGSFYDWSETSDPFDLTIADVVGAGDGAALIAATVRSAFRARRHLQPGEAVQQVNEQLVSDFTASDTSATVFHGRFDPRSGRLDYVDAGHGLTVLIRSTGELDALPPTGLPLGVAARTGWTHHTVHLRPGDALVSATVGLVDLFAGSEPMTSIAALASTGTAHEIIERIATAVSAGSPSGDVTVVSITRPPEAAP